MNRLIAPLLCLALCVSIVGCQQRVAREDLGEVQFEVPRVAGMEKPVEVPGLDLTHVGEKRPAEGRK